MILSEHPNWIFVTFVNGGFGHQLARVLMTSIDTVWYDQSSNGSEPWEWNHLPAYTGFGCSPNHFLKWFKGTPMLPVLDDFSEWAEVGTYETFNQPWITDILNVKKIVYTCHDSPQYIRERFPNAKIVLIDIDDTDWAHCIKNQIEKTGNYAAVIPNTKTDTGDKALWAKSTGRNLLRDWQQHINNLKDQKAWIQWTVNKMVDDMETMRGQLSCVDSVIKSNKRNDIDAVVKVHNDIGIRPNIEGITKVIDAFNLDNLIKTAYDIKRSL